MIGVFPGFAAEKWKFEEKTLDAKRFVQFAQRSEQRSELVATGNDRVDLETLGDEKREAVRSLGESILISNRLDLDSWSPQWCFPDGR